ncbi:phenazine biosynthesis FMN-dependent oxidase PhzG [Streptomyces sp. OF3]|uniref:Phenazine biosynthesis FMN-dependent oxidase PhzG n=2 Tax=Streptomyces alkaliterrae TaxID=2213162 RepID=A0A5P0YJI3_9ACTN|nr:phenazine biosynthesis FMN-dependent oxidase PhzG [Streptomyces alkaliterrae]MBB1258110.1 phenazine biosynthesis FMN-dependent oxidase PhzG [Streptomyces alkaliterrae]MQS00534.1 pyridoxamine 5'-phosphate oxidase [Streptomyces alkaliterrae]
MTATVEVPFPEFTDPPAGPLELLREWLDDAACHAVREPRALALATADARGRSSSRVVVVSRLTGAGLVFLTHVGSRKGRDLAVNPWASGVLYWRETAQQVCVAGPVHRLTAAETEELWRARPVFTHAMTTASRQSEPLGGVAEVEALRRRAGELALGGRPLPCPETFAAYELRFDSVEFWANGTDRLHERLRYERDGERWRVERLQP